MLAFMFTAKIKNSRNHRSLVSQLSPSAALTKSAATRRQGGDDHHGKLGMTNVVDSSHACPERTLDWCKCRSHNDEAIAW